MFEDLDDKLELDLFTQAAPDDYVEDSTETKYANKKKMSEVSILRGDLLYVRSGGVNCAGGIAFWGAVQAAGAASVPLEEIPSV